MHSMSVSIQATLYPTDFFQADVYSTRFSSHWQKFIPPKLIHMNFQSFAYMSSPMWFRLQVWFNFCEIYLILACGDVMPKIHILPPGLISVRASSIAGAYPLHSITRSTPQLGSLVWRDLSSSGVMMSKPVSAMIPWNRWLWFRMDRGQD